MPIKYVISDRTIILTEKTSNDPSAGSPYGNHVTTFPSSPHYNLKASTIRHVVNIISNDKIGKSEGPRVQKTVTYSTRTINLCLLGIPRYN